MPKRSKRPTDPQEIEARKAEFLKVYPTVKTIIDAARAVDTFAPVVEQWREEDPEFEEAYQQLVEAKIGRRQPRKFKPRNPLPDKVLQEKWIEAFLKIGTKGGANEAVGISRHRLYNWEKDPEFVKARDDAFEDFSDKLEGYIITAAAEDWRAADRMLQVRRSNLFGKNASGEEGTTIINVGESVFDSLVRHAKRVTGEDEPKDSDS